MLAKEVADTLKKLLSDVDSDLIREIRNAKWEDRKALLNQLDTLKQVEERLYASIQ